MEQTLTDARGLPGRDWYRHLVYAPGQFTGYGVKTLPGVREAIEQSRWEEANQYAAITAGALRAYCDRLEQATAVLSHPQNYPSKSSIARREGKQPTSKPLDLPGIPGN